MQRIQNAQCFPPTTDRTFRWRTATIAICVFAFLADVSWAQTLTPVPVEQSHLSVSLGRSSVFQTQSDIKEIRVADDKVCNAEVIGNDRNSISVTGLKRGSTTITVWLTQPNTTPQTYVVDVVTAADAYKVLNDFILQQSPTSRIVLNPSPTSNKVIVSGSVTSRHEWEKVLTLIHGTIPRSDLIIQVQIPCPPCIPCVQCTSSCFRCRLGR